MSDKELIEKMKSLGGNCYNAGVRIEQLQAQLDRVKTVKHESIAYVDKKTRLRLTREVVMLDDLLAAIKGDGDV